MGKELIFYKGDYNNIMDYTVTDNGSIKRMKSPLASYLFDKRDGTMFTWGSSYSKEASRFPAPTILDIEVTTICNGGCKFCYKSNTSTGRNMSFETFKHIIDIFPQTLTQIAFGADANLTSNPDLWKMMRYVRKKGIVPNITAAWFDEKTADKLAEYCGAVALSRYEHTKDKCYDSIKLLTDRDMEQVNMHFMLAEETYQQCLETLDEIATDDRLKYLNAFVILSLKTKGRGAGFHSCSQEHFNEIVKKAQDLHIRLGFDSCSSAKALEAFCFDEALSKCVISCEASRESSYINVDGEYYPCSFCEGEEGWERGLSVLECNSEEDFVEKIWNNPRTLSFLDRLNATTDNHSCRHCPMFRV